MIIPALAHYYDQLLERHSDDVPRPGWCSKWVKGMLVLSEDGALINVIPASEKRGWEKTVPEQVEVTSSPRANFLCGNSKYLLGIEAKEGASCTEEHFELSRELHCEWLQGVDSVCARAVCAYYESWDPRRASEHPVILRAEDIVYSGNLVFAVADARGVREVLDDCAVQEAVAALGASRLESGSEKMLCFDSGALEPAEKVHPSIQGVYGAHSRGAKLVSFNNPSFCSYGCDEDAKGLNAPISKRSAQAYVTALEYLLSHDNHHFRLGDTTVVYWSEQCDDGNCDLIGSLLDFTTPFDQRSGANEDTDKNLDVALREIALGHLPDIEGADFGSTFYMLGIAPNAARLAIRFFMRDAFGSVVKNIQRYYEDTAVAHGPGEKERLAPCAALKSLENSNSKDPVVSSQLSASFLRAVLEGSRYPDALYTNTLLRIRATHKVSRENAAIIKAYLIRNAGKSREEITVELNRERDDIAYCLGRAFAISEQIQAAANGDKSNIAARYLNSACSTPGIVFPVLFKLTNAHLVKLDRDMPGFAVAMRREMGSVMKGIQTFPKRLSLESQGDFELGYYHQTEDRYKPKAKKENQPVEEMQE